MTHDATTGNNYSFDQENRITGAAGYAYTVACPELPRRRNADGNRVEKSNGTTGTIYWYMSPGIVGESDLTGSLKSEYVYFDGERVARKDFSGSTTSVAYYFSDHLKTASVITNAAGTITEDEDYYPWGGELQFTNNDSNHYKFTGKERDAESGLDYFGARYYGNAIGRWITPDKPFADQHPENPQSWNLYMYAANRPTSLIDTDGREVKETVTYKTYDVHGSTAAEARANALAVSPVQENGQTFMGGTQPAQSVVNIKTSEDVQGYEGVAVTDTISVKSADVKLDQTVILPNWVEADKASPLDKADWTGQMEGLKEHEDGHVKINSEGAHELDKSLPGTKGLGSGTTGTQAQAAASKKLNGAIKQKQTSNQQNTQKRNADYDQKTQHGLKQHEDQK